MSFKAECIGNPTRKRGILATRSVSEDPWKSSLTRRVTIYQPVLCVNVIHIPKNATTVPKNASRLMRWRCKIHITGIANSGQVDINVWAIAISLPEKATKESQIPSQVPKAVAGTMYRKCSTLKVCMKPRRYFRRLRINKLVAVAATNNRIAAASSGPHDSIPIVENNPLPAWQAAPRTPQAIPARNFPGINPGSSCFALRSITTTITPLIVKATPIATR